MKKDKEFIRCCPFCGSHEVGIARTNPIACWVVCTECDAQTESRPERAQAIDIWNQRYFDDRPSKIVWDDDERRNKK
jgi:Lar family restriction alleviation protein